MLICRRHQCRSKYILPVKSTKVYQVSLWGTITADGENSIIRGDAGVTTVSLGRIPVIPSLCITTFTSVTNFTSFDHRWRSSRKQVPRHTGRLDQRIDLSLLLVGDRLLFCRDPCTDHVVVLQCRGIIKRALWPPF